MVELRHLVTFSTIVEVGGFKKAADELGYAQASITAHVKELESELEYPLFDRLGKHISLTQAGEKFLPYALDIISLYDQSKEVIKEENELSGELKIGVSESLMAYWLPYIIKDFIKSYPKVSLIIKSIDFDHLTNQLKKGDIDAALLLEKSNWQSNQLTLEKIKNENLTFVQSPQILNNYHETMLVTEYSCSWRPIINDYLKFKQDTNLEMIALPSIEAIKKCVVHGLGKSILPYFIVQNEVENGELEVIPNTLGDQQLAIYMAYHKDKWIPNSLKELSKQLSEVMS